MNFLSHRQFLLSPALCTLFFLLWAALLFPVHAQVQMNGATRSELERQLIALEEEVAEIDVSVKKTQREAKSFNSEKKLLEAEEKRRTLEIRRLNLVINKVALDIGIKRETIPVLTKKIKKSREALGGSILLLYTYGRENPLMLLFKHRSLSGFFGSLNALSRVQNDIKITISDFREKRALLEKEKKELEEFEKEQGDLKVLQEVERRFLVQKKKEKQQLLELTKGKEQLFQKLLQSKQHDIAALKTQLFYLEQTGITAEEAVRLAELAARRTGIRPAFLLALLEVETGKQFEDGVITVGTNLGTGNWKRDMYDCYMRIGKRNSAESEKNAFMKITSSLGLDPDKMPVSRMPNYGCGGAMGPAQFISTTWLRFADRVAVLTGHRPPSPWNTEDAFTAAALFLADAGARTQTPAGEIAAAKTYLSGNPRCTRSICRYYSNRVIALAKEIDRIL